MKFRFTHLATWQSEGLKRCRCNLPSIVQYCRLLSVCVGRARGGPENSGRQGSVLPELTIWEERQPWGQRSPHRWAHAGTTQRRTWLTPIGPRARTVFPRRWRLMLGLERGWNPGLLT